jgi:hypothetical protein
MYACRSLFNLTCRQMNLLYTAGAFLVNPQIVHNSILVGVWKFWYVVSISNPLVLHGLEVLGQAILLVHVPV